jgi:ABC-type polysaccharide/polyol phosphate export permease
MYATPIFYPASIVPHKYAIILQLNPLCYFMDIFRMTLYVEGPQLPMNLFYGGLCSFAAFSAGWFFYNRYKERIIYYL